MPPPSSPTQAAETCPAAAAPDKTGRRQPSLGGRRTFWRDRHGKETTVCPPQKISKVDVRGMVPTSSVVYLNGSDSKFFIHIRPSTSPCIATSFRRRRRGRKPRKRRKLHPKWQLPGLSLSPRLHHTRSLKSRPVHPQWPLPGLALSSSSHCSIISHIYDAEGGEAPFQVDRVGSKAPRARSTISGTLWDPGLARGGGARKHIGSRGVPLIFFSKRGSRLARKDGPLPRGVDRPGRRSHQRISVGSANVRSLKGDKFKLACHEFVRRRFFICGVSEHWLTGNGVLEDDATGFFFVYSGHKKDDNSRSGKHGVGFLLSPVAYK